MKQKKDRYEMHKYWGKKPSAELGELIKKYSNEGDTVLDPFSGYGVFCCEALLLNRRVISNDLNPVTNFLNSVLLNTSIDFEKLDYEWSKIKNSFKEFNDNWFTWYIGGEKVTLISILRDKNDRPIRAKYLHAGEKRSNEIALDSIDVEQYLQFEESQQIKDWYPNDNLIENSRISAKPSMTVSSLFTKRTLSCHARLFTLINSISSGPEKELLKLAFTANLANCSKLVPPIKSRGQMSQGAWMTGFYTGDTYIENNVLVYFQNRLKKAIKGKKDFINALEDSSKSETKSGDYQNLEVTNYDAKNLKIEPESIDYIFADPPYGSAVPYFEQSIIWNAWLSMAPDYENEIVISDSKKRSKTDKDFVEDINKAFSEFRRVLKPNGYLSITYHSLSGLEWRAITNACIKNGFELDDYKWMVQKSFTPRQLNRIKTVKGDVLVTLKKASKIAEYEEINSNQLSDELLKKINEWLIEQPLDTNQIFLKVMAYILEMRIVSEPVNLLKLLTKNLKINETGIWTPNDKL